MTDCLTLPKRLVIFDLDGVIYRGDTPTPAAAEVIQRLRRRGMGVRFFTNNSSQTRASYVQKLAGMGIGSSVEEIMTSAHATGLYLTAEGSQMKRVLVVGETGLVEELRSVGLEVLPSSEARENDSVDAVVVGIDRGFTYGRLRKAQSAIFGGARFVATNTDATFPTEAGDMPGGGAIVAAIQTASGQAPYVVGKPNTYALEMILTTAGVGRNEAVLVGDRLETDILVGRSAGLDTVLTLTGVSQLAEVERASADMKPTTIIEDLRFLEATLLPDEGPAGTPQGR